MKASGSKVNDYSDISDRDPTTDITGAELEDLTDGGETIGHTHANMLIGEYVPAFKTLVITS